MWAMYENYKNHYLRTELKHLTHLTVNELIQKEVEKRKTKIEYSCSVAPKFTQSKYLDDHTQLAYGLWALPKLMKEIGSDDDATQFKAINSLSEYIVNPLHAQRAITQFQIVRRCQNIFLRIRMKYQKSKYRDAVKLLDIFYYVAKHMNGVHEVVHSNRLMDQFYIIIRDREEHMLKTSKILSLLTEQTTAATYLINTYKVMDKLINIWSRDICVSYYPEDLWIHLGHILEKVPHQAVEIGFFEILYTRIKGGLFQFHRYDLKCFALLLRCEEGQKRFVAADGVKKMYLILTDSLNMLDSYENVVFTLMNGMFAKPILWRCREFTDLPLIVTDLARNSKDNNMQLLCFQLLRELGDMPCIKRYMQVNCLRYLKEVNCLSTVNKEVHGELIYWLQREIYHTKDLRK